MNCYRHPTVSAVGTCVNCGKAVCADCATMVSGAAGAKTYCPECTAAGRMSGIAPCPQCGNISASKVSWSWWGGLLGPRILNHVKCNSCGTTYNSKTGKSNTTAIVIYYAVVLGIALACALACMIMNFMAANSY